MPCEKVPTLIRQKKFCTREKYQILIKYWFEDFDAILLFNYLFKFEKSLSKYENQFQQIFNFFSFKLPI